MRPIAAVLCDKLYSVALTWCDSMLCGSLDQSSAHGWLHAGAVYQWLSAVMCIVATYADDFHNLL